MATETREAHLSIGDLAEATGVSAATLRIWETRHGFPEPTRLPSGHRRFGPADVAAVRRVVGLRGAGIRLDVAIAQAVDEQSSAPIGNDSVFARLRATHPALQPTQLAKSTLLGMSWAIEDEFCAQARRGHVFGAFQQVSRFESARARWAEIARVSDSTFVFADFDAVAEEPPVCIPLAPDAPMIREWAVVCDTPSLGMALTAWELPGQVDVPDMERVFETLWTVDPEPVREAARVCAAVASAAGSRRAAHVVDELAAPVVTGRTDIGALTSLFNRSVSYVDAKMRR